LSTICC